MKNTGITLLLFFAGALTFSSCSKCYECTREIEIQSGGQTVAVEEDTDEFCTVDENEVDLRRADGENCKPV